jgi:hypothetical protein
VTFFETPALSVFAADVFFWEVCFENPLFLDWVAFFDEVDLLVLELLPLAEFWLFAAVLPLDVVLPLAIALLFELVLPLEPTLPLGAVLPLGPDLALAPVLPLGEVLPLAVLLLDAVLPLATLFLEADLALDAVLLLPTVFFFEPVLLLGEAFPLAAETLPLVADLPLDADFPLVALDFETTLPFGLALALGPVLRFADLFLAEIPFFEETLPFFALALVLGPFLLLLTALPVSVLRPAAVLLFKLLLPFDVASPLAPSLVFDPFLSFTTAFDDELILPLKPILDLNAFLSAEANLLVVPAFERPLNLADATLPFFPFAAVALPDLDSAPEAFAPFVAVVAADLDFVPLASVAFFAAALLAK